jgi:hypothetical protein
MLRAILRSEKNEITGGWKNLDNEVFVICTLLTKYNPNDKVEETGMCKA